MKKYILSTLLLIAASLQTLWAQTVVLYKSNGQSVEYEVADLDSIVFREAVPKLVTSITLNETSITLQPDEMKILTATVLPANADNPAVTWESSNEDVAEVNGRGRVIANGIGTCTITCQATDGSRVYAECEVTVTSGTTPDSGNHEWVDLGLPSGTKWATCNVGASSPEEYGDYFAWGETSTKTNYSWSTYKWMNAGQSSWKQINKYTFADGQTACWYSGGTFIGDGKTELEPEDDAATVNWGSDWQMPSPAQIQELYNSSYTTTQWITVNGVKGRKVTSKSNGNSLFLPAAGLRDTSLINAGSNGHYWSRSLWTNFSDFAYCLKFDFGSIGIANDGKSRYYGRSVRPVRVQETVPVQLVTSITLSPSTVTLEPGGTRSLTATVTPSDATNKELTWSSSNTSIATVSTSGMVTAKAAGSCTITATAMDGSGVKGTCQVTVKSPDTGTTNGHEWVDLGFPSGTLWATCNVGASSPEKYGNYYAWGETTTKSKYWVDTYQHCWGNASGSARWTKYCLQSEYGYQNMTDGLSELQPVDDAATANWGSGWQMPSDIQVQELFSNTTKEFTTQNGVNGLKLISKSNGNSIFLPAAGGYSAPFGGAGNRGQYWTRSLYTSHSAYAEDFSFYFDEGKSYINLFQFREFGLTVRPVRKQ